MTVVPGLRFASTAWLVATTAALGPPTSVGAVWSPQAASSAVSADVTIKKCRIGLSLVENSRSTVIPADASAYYVFLLIAGPRPITSFYYCRIAGVALPCHDAGVDTRHIRG